MADSDHGMPEAVVTTTNEVYVVNGRETWGIGITVTPEHFEQYRLGYRCIACHHFPQPEAFPDHCCEDYCRFPIKRDQLRFLEFEDRGEETLLVDDEDDVERIRHDLRGQGIWLPND